MKRRALVLALLGGSLSPFLAHAEDSRRVFRVGFLGVGREAPGTGALLDAFLDEMKENGFSEGRNLTVDFRRSDDPRGVGVAGAELSELKPDVIVAQGPEAALKAVLDASGNTPIVFQAINYDPIERGYVASIARPGGRVTGIFYRQAELAAKKVELLAQAFPQRRRLAVLWDEQVKDEFAAASRATTTVGLELHALKLEKPPYDFDEAFRSIAQNGAEILLVLSSPLFARSRQKLARLTIEYQLPSMFIFKTYVEAGGLMSYGVEQSAIYRRTADFVAKILNGTSPADLPVEQASKFELVVNLKTAKAIGVDLPPVFLARADEVIE